MGDKCKLMRPKATRVGDKCGRQVWKTSVNSCSPRHPEWETSVEDKCKLTRPKAPRVGGKCGRLMEDKCRLMRPKAPRVGDKWETIGRQVQIHTAQGTQSGRQV